MLPSCHNFRNAGKANELICGAEATCFLLCIKKSILTGRKGSWKSKREGGRRNGATGDRGTYWATGHDPRREVFDSLVLLYVEYKQKMGSLSVSAPQN